MWAFCEFVVGALSGDSWAIWWTALTLGVTWLTTKLWTAYSWVSIKVGNATVRIRRHMGPIQWIGLIAGLAACAKAYQVYTTSVKRAEAGYHSDVALREKKLRKAWKKFITFVGTACVFTCQLSTNQTAREIGHILRELSKSFRDAKTLYEFAADSCDMFDDDGDDDDEAHPKSVRFSESKPDSLPDLFGAETQPKPVAPPPKIREVSQTDTALMSSTTTVKFSEADLARLAKADKIVSDFEAEEKVKATKAAEAKAKSDEEEKFKAVKAAEKKAAKKAKKKAAEAASSEPVSGEAISDEDMAKAMSGATVERKKAQGLFGEDSDPDDDDEDTMTDKVKRFFSPLFNGHDILNDEHDVAFSAKSFERVRPFFSTEADDVDPVPLSRIERLRNFRNITWREMPLYMSNRVYSFFHYSFAYIHDFVSGFYREVRDNISLWRCLSLVLAFTGVYAAFRFIRSRPSRKSEGGSGNKMNKADRKRQQRAAHNPYQKQKEAEYKKKLEDELQREKDLDEMERREEERLRQQESNEDKYNEYLEKKAAQREADEKDREKEDEAWEKMTTAEKYRAARGRNDARQGPAPRGGNPALNRSTRKGESDERRENCALFYRTGRCPDGDSCKFAHVSGPQRVCSEWKQRGTCGYKGCKYAHPIKKSEQLMPDSPVVKAPFLCEVESIDRNGRRAFANAHVTHDTVVMPRHCVAGKVKVILIADGKRYELGVKSYISRTMPDQCWFRKPSGVKNNSGKYREPVVGEQCMLNWIRDALSVFTVGIVVAKQAMGADRKIVAYDYSGSTVSGSCCAVYRSLVDGAFIGLHGVGSDSPKVFPQFFGCNAGWLHELSTWSDKDTHMHVEDLKYGTGDGDGLDWDRTLNNQPLNSPGGK